MATVPVKLLTVEEFAQIPNPPGGVYELVHGEVVSVSFADIVHLRAQRQLRLMLEPLAHPSGIVDKEIPYRPLPEHECWVADVAYVTHSRWETIDRWFMGSPELVAEVLSPSNTASEIIDKEQICLKNGAREFWVVDTRRKQVKVSTADGHTTMYRFGQRIPVFFAPGESIPVETIFA